MAAEEAFPSPFELQVASALLLLSTTTTAGTLAFSSPPERSSKKKNKKKKKEKSLIKLPVSRSNWSCSSSSVTVDNQPRMKVITVVTNFHEMVKLEMVRKRRSKTFCISDCRKISSGAPETKIEASASASSCLSSSSSSAISSARSPDAIQRRENCLLLRRAKDSKPKPILGSGHMRRRAEAILKVLTAHGSVSEVRIRELLGDCPSTSKALRILLNLEQVKRSGAGGRTDPYIYTIA